MHISYLAIRTWLACRQRYHYEYVLRVQPQRENPDLLLGTGIHAAIDAHHSGLDATCAFTAWFLAFEREHPAPTLAIAEERTAWYTLGCGMLDTYSEWAETHDDFASIIATEYEFSVPIPGTDGYLDGRIDSIIADAAGQLWLLEYKTAKSFYDDGHLDLDLQSSLYQWAFQHLLDRGDLPELDGHELTGVLFTTLRKAVPKTPELLASGKGLSKAVSFSTTASLYRAAIRQYGFDEREYSSHLAKLDAQGNTFIRREEMYRSPTELAQVEEDLYTIYVDMAQYGLIYPSPTKWCPRCAFYQPCVNRRKGDDEATTLATHFITRERHIQRVAEGVA
jgi:hypothetical protein